MQEVSLFVVHDTTLHPYRRECKCKSRSRKRIVVLGPLDPIVGLVLEQNFIDQLLYSFILVDAVMLIKCQATRLLNEMYIK